MCIIDVAQRDDMPFGCGRTHHSPTGRMVLSQQRRNIGQTKRANFPIMKRLFVVAGDPLQLFNGLHDTILHCHTVSGSATQHQHIVGHCECALRASVIDSTNVHGLACLVPVFHGTWWTLRCMRVFVYKVYANRVTRQSQQTSKETSFSYVIKWV